MASDLGTFFGDGQQMVERGPDEDDEGLSVSSRGRAASGSAKSRAAKAPASKAKAKRGQGAVLSSSFTCWRVTPVPRPTAYVLIVEPVYFRAIDDPSESGP